MKKWTNKIRKFWQEEEGLGTLEIVSDYCGCYYSCPVV